MFLFSGVVLGMVLLVLYALGLRKYLKLQGRRNVPAILVLCSLVWVGLILCLKYWDPGFAFAVALGGIIDMIGLGILAVLRRFLS